MEISKGQRQFQKTKALLFDFDGTLAVLNIDFGSMREQVFNLLRDFGVEEKLIKERYLLEVIDEAYPILREKSLSDAEAFYLKAHQALHEIEMKAAGEGRLIPKVEVTLKKLRRAGIKIGIITRNCDDAVRKVFPEIDQYCDIFISRNGTTKVKPHPDHLTAALRALGVPAEEAVMVGDHPLDIQAGKRAGMKTIGVLTGRTKREEFEKAEADYVMTDVSEICEMIGDLKIE
jgi:phosphoglycolate phosphatase